MSPTWAWPSRRDGSGANSPTSSSSTLNIMPAVPQTEATGHPALTALSEEERFFQSTVRKFAQAEIRPYVREMDEVGVFRKEIIRQFFEMGLMGIEIPEEYGGQGGTFFQAILAVEDR